MVVIYEEEKKIIMIRISICFRNYLPDNFASYNAYLTTDDSKFDGNEHKLKAPMLYEYQDNYDYHDQENYFGLIQKNFQDKSSFDIMKKQIE